MPGPLLVGSALNTLRKAGAVEAVRDLMSPTADAVVFAVTNLGDTWFLLVALTLFYWYGTDADDRRNGAIAIAVALAGLGLVVGLKATFALGRPPAHLHAYPEEGFGFPSGHALGATVAWGAMAWLGDRWDRRRALGVAVPVVAAIGLSRVALGVHYLGSVLAGFLVGALLLWGALRVARGDPLRVFGIAVVAAVFAVLAGASAGSSAMAASAAANGVTGVGAALGGALAWYGLDLDGSVHPATALGGLVVFGGLFVAVEVTEPHLAVRFLANGVVVAGLLAVPAGERTAREWFGERRAGGSAGQNVSR